MTLWEAAGTSAQSLRERVSGGLCSWNSWNSGTMDGNSCEWGSFQVAVAFTTTLLLVASVCFCGIGAGAGLGGDVEGRIKAAERERAKKRKQSSEMSSPHHRRLRSLGGEARRISKSKSPARRRSLGDGNRGTIKSFLKNLEADVDDMIMESKEEAQKIYKDLERLNSKYGFSAVLKKLRERRKYKEVVSQGTQGDGLTSIFAPERRMFDARGNSSVVYENAPDASARTDGLFASRAFAFSTHEDQLVARQLAASEFFEWMTQQQLKFLCDSLERTTLKSGAPLFEKGENVCAAFLVVDGCIAITADVHSASSGEGSGCTFSAGDFASGLFNLLSAIVGKPLEAVATAKATSESTIVHITHSALQTLFKSYPGVKEDLLRRTLMRIHRVTFMGVGALFQATMPFSGGETGQDSPRRSMTPDRASATTRSEWRKVASELVAEELGVESGALGPLIDWNDDFFDDGSIMSRSPSSKNLKTIGSVDIVELRPGQKLLDLGQEPAMFVVLRGALCAEDVSDESLGRQCMVSTGRAVGHLSLITGAWSDWYAPSSQSDERVRMRVTASTRYSDSTLLARISRKCYYSILARFPIVMLRKAERLLSTVSSLLRILDLCTLWVQKQSGEVLVKQGERASHLFIVLHGRLRATKKDCDDAEADSEYSHSSIQRQWGSHVKRLSSMSDGSSSNSGTPTRKNAPHINPKEETVAEFGRGDSIGELELVIGTAHDASVRVMRDTQLAALPMPLLRKLSAVYPETMLYMSKRVTRKIILSDRGYRGASKRRVVALFPVTPSVNLDSFALTLSRALNSMGTTTDVLTSQRLLVRRSIGFEGSELDHFEAMSQLNEAEETNDLVLYNCDPCVDPLDPLSLWTILCLKQADTILFIGNSIDDPSTHFIETKLQRVNTNADRELVLLYNSAGASPQATRKWVEARGNIHRHHHIRVHTNEPSYDVTHFKSDFRRLGRWLTGNSVGVVLGGGGARGMSQLSVLRALEEEGIPVDFIGGTSIGAFMGALYAQKTDTLDMYGIVARFARGMGSVWKQIRDLTFPITAYFTGLAFNRIIVSVFEDLKIEDCWLPYFCVTTDLTDSEERTHQNGSAWRYVRASMTLTGYLPPISDTEVTKNGEKKTHFLVDGGYTNELPVNTMRSIVGQWGTVIAVDVKSNFKFERESFGDSISGTAFLLRWLNPFSRTPNWPTASDIQTQLAWISAVQQERTSTRLRSRLVDLYIRPPVGDYGTLEWGKRLDILDIGYEHGTLAVKEWLGTLKARNDPRLKMFKPGNDVIRDVIDARLSESRHNKARSVRFSDASEAVKRASSPLRSFKSYEDLGRAASPPSLSL